jgi:hypothetical protein
MLDGLIISRAQALQLNKFNQQQLQNKIVDLGTTPVAQPELTEAPL